MDGRRSWWDRIRPFLTALVILGFSILLSSYIYSLNMDVGAKSTLMGVVIGGGLTFLGQMWAQDANNTHQLRMAEIDYKNQLRMVALERRLQAHQEAFALWRRLFFLTYGDDQESLNDVARESRTWWDNNCLYLSKEVADAFLSAIFIATRLHDLHWRQTTLLSSAQMEQLTDSMEKNWEKLKSAGEIIADGIGLPSPNLEELAKEGKPERLKDEK